jgi:acyl-CoA thioesterase
MEFTREHLEYAQSRVRLSKFSALMGFEVVKLSNGGAILTVTTEDRHRQIHNVVHGGVIAALADTAAAIAAYTVVPRGTEVVTIELKINYLLPVSEGKLTADGKVLRAGRNFIVVECDVIREDGALAAKALMTFGAAPGHALASEPSARTAEPSLEHKRREFKVARPIRKRRKR